MPVLRSLGLATASRAVIGSGLVVTAPTADAASGIYRNGTALHTTWRHGLGRATAHDSTSGGPVRTFFHSTRQYKIAMRRNRGLDRDRHGLACESR